MAFGFGGDLSVDRSLGGRGPVSRSIDRGLSVDGRVTTRGAEKPDENFFQGQRRRSQADRGAALRDPGYRPEQDPEFGDTPTRGDQIEAIERVYGSSLSALLRGDFSTAAELFARDIGRGLGVEEEIATEVVTDKDTDRQSVVFGTRGSLNLLRLGSNLPLGVGLSAAVAVGRAFGPFSGLQVGLNALGQSQSVAAAGDLAPRVSLGFRPTTGAQRRALGRRAAGQAPTAEDAFAFDYLDRRRASIEAAERQRANRTDRPPADLARSMPTQAPVTTASAPAPAPDQARFGRVFGDSRLTPDPLRTTEQAAVAAGVRSPRPRLTTRAPARPGRLLF